MSPRSGISGLLRDVLSVSWKEFRELTASEGRESGLFGLMIFVALLGVFLPWQIGTAWLTAPWVLLFWVWIPIFLMTTVMPDSFAGERERQTLGTLLTTRLSDEAILAGKMGAAILYVWGATLLCIPLSLASVNLRAAEPGLVLYSPAQLAMVSGLALLAAMLGAGLGVLVSMNARTVRHAQQTFSLGILAAFAVPLLLTQTLPAARRGLLLSHMFFGEARPVALSVGFGLAVLNFLLLVVATKRFRRERLLR